MTIYHQDPRLLGVSSIVTADGTRMAASCRDARRVVMLALAGGAIVGDTGDLGAEPGQILALDGTLWTVLDTGELVGLTIANDPAVDITTDIHATTNRWLAGAGTVLIAPGRPGSVVALSTEGAVLFTYDGVMDGIAAAVADGGYLYLLDGAGNGLVCTLNSTTGALAPYATFRAANCQDVRRLVVDGTDLVVLTRDRFVVLDISDPSDIPAADGTLYDRPCTFRDVAVLASGSYWLASDEGIASQAYAFPFASTAAALTALLAVGHGPTARLSYAGDGFTDYDDEATGSTSTAHTFTLPAGAGAGLVTVTGVDDGLLRRLACGFSFVVTADGVQILSTSCLVNASTSAVIPAGTVSVVVTVTAQCSDLGSGSWTASVEDT